MNLKHAKIKLKGIVAKYIKRRNKLGFIYSVPQNAKVLDVGCGSDSPLIFKTLRPDIYYVGIDIEIHKQTVDVDTYADEFMLVEPDDFHKKINGFKNEFDAIVCSHNLEHCNDYIAVTHAMLGALKDGGSIHIIFPCEESVRFPSREGTLNFYDDDTHNNVIEFAPFISLLQKNNIDIVFSTQRYRPVVPFVIGLVCEPVCSVINRLAPAGGTWALYGFETVITGKKRGGGG